MAQQISPLLYNEQLRVSYFDTRGLARAINSNPAAVDSIHMASVEVESRKGVILQALWVSRFIL